jgi:hypothetical protein
MTATEPKTMSLEAFLAEYAVCRVWYTSTAAPAGSETALDLEAEGEDYCDAEGLANVLEHCGAIQHAAELEGTVTRDKDSEYRWQVGSLEGVGASDVSGNTLLNLVVWGEGRPSPRVVTISVVTAPGTNASTVGEAYGSIGAAWRNSVDRCDDDGCGRVFLDCDREAVGYICEELDADERVTNYTVNE